MVRKQRKRWKKKEVVKQKDQRFPKYKGAFYGYCHCYNKFGHKAVDCRIKEEDQVLKRKEDTNISNGKRLITCFIFHIVGNFAKHCKNSTCILSKETQEKGWKMKSKREINRRHVSRVPHGKMWRRKLDYKDSKHQ